MAEFVARKNLQGQSGFSGYSGLSGRSGFSGYSGTNGATGTSGFSGYSAFSGYSGKSGFSGYSGSAGTSGFSGYSGTYGGDSMPYLFSSAISGDPGSGYLLLNDGPPNSVTKINLNNANQDGANIGTWLLGMYASSSAVKGYIRITKRGQPSNFLVYQIFAGGGDFSDNYTDISVLIVQYNGFFNHGDPVIVSFSRTGDSGYSGRSGFSGYSGRSGYSGFSGYSGASGFSGYSGKSGFSGYSGTNGSTGASGFSGYSAVGVSGFSGFSGISGFSGYSGASVTGASGFSGYSGASTSGFSGYSGTSGFSGYSGKSGFSGYSGTNGATGASGFSGYSGTGISGFSGYSGAQGSTGTSGFSGYSGIFGGDSQPYTITTVTGTTPPANGELHFDVAITDAARLYISNTNRDLVSTEQWVGSFDQATGTNKGTIRIVKQGNSAIWATYAITGNVAVPNGYSFVDVQFVDGPGTFSNNDKVIVSFTKSGDSGFSGYSGISGRSGYSGSGVSGFSGYSGRSGYSGYSGLGLSGFSGYSGNSTSGYSGYSGTSGFSGYSGRSGFSGYSGLSTRNMGITIGGGGVITTGSKGIIRTPVAGTITKATLIADQSGSIAIDIKKSSYSSFPTNSSITASAKPTLTSAQKSEDSTLTGWTTSFSAGDVIEFLVDASVTPASVTRVTVILDYTA